MPPPGLGDVERGVEIALAHNTLAAASRGYNNLAQIALLSGEPRRYLELLEEAERLGQRLGNRDLLKYVQAQLIEIIWRTGRWDEALRRTDEFLRESTPGSPHVLDGWVRQMRAEVLIARDDEDAALDDIAKALTLARKSDDPFRLLQALAHTIRLYVALRQFDRAQALAEEVRSHRPDVVARYVLPTLALHKEVLGLTDDDLEAYLEHLLPELAEAEVCRLIVAGDFERLADLMAQRENPQFEAEVRMQAVKQLLGKGRHEDAAAQADKALSFYRSVGATRYIREAEELLTVTNAAGEQRPI